MYLFIHNKCFLDDFHGINLLGGLQFYHQHLGITTSANHFQYCKVVQGDLRFTYHIGVLETLLRISNKALPLSVAYTHLPLQVFVEKICSSTFCWLTIFCLGCGSLCKSGTIYNITVTTMGWDC